MTKAEVTLHSSITQPQTSLTCLGLKVIPSLPTVTKSPNLQIFSFYISFAKKFANLDWHFGQEDL